MSTRPSPMRLRKAAGPLARTALRGVITPFFPSVDRTAWTVPSPHPSRYAHYPPKVSLSKLVNSLKGVSSRKLRDMRPEITGRYHQGVLWSPSYFVASCGGAPLSIIAEYVRNQREGALPPRPERRGFRARN